MYEEVIQKKLSPRLKLTCRSDWSERGTEMVIIVGSCHAGGCCYAPGQFHKSFSRCYNVNWYIPEHYISLEGIAEEGVLESHVFKCFTSTHMHFCSKEHSPDFHAQRKYIPFELLLSFLPPCSTPCQSTLILKKNKKRKIKRFLYMALYCYYVPKQS